MKKIIFLFLVILSTTISITCSKDELETTDDLNAQSLPSAVVESRAATNTSSLIFYRSSLTTDNYLVNSAPRTHIIYNKAKIREIQFTATSVGLANIGGVICKHYKLRIIYTDNTTDSFEAYSKSDVDKFDYVPTTTGLLTPRHTGKKIRIVSTNTLTQSNSYYNFWLDKNTTWIIWNIYKDNQLVQQRYLESLDKNAAQFLPQHAH
jgi:hypothetical protein